MSRKDFVVEKLTAKIKADLGLNVIDIIRHPPVDHETAAWTAKVETTDELGYRLISSFWTAKEIINAAHGLLVLNEKSEVYLDIEGKKEFGRLNNSTYFERNLELMEKDKVLKKIETIIGKLISLSGNLPNSTNTDCQEAIQNMQHLRDCIRSGAINFSKRKKQ